MRPTTLIACVLLGGGVTGLSACNGRVAPTPIASETRSPASGSPTFNLSPPSAAPAPVVATANGACPPPSSKQAIMPSCRPAVVHVAHWRPWAPSMRFVRRSAPRWWAPHPWIRHAYAPPQGDFRPQDPLDDSPDAYRRRPLDERPLNDAPSADAYFSRGDDRDHRGAFRHDHADGPPPPPPPPPRDYAMDHPAEGPQRHDYASDHPAPGPESHGYTMQHHEDVTERHGYAVDHHSQSDLQSATETRRSYDASPPESRRWDHSSHYEHVEHVEHEESYGPPPVKRWTGLNAQGFLTWPGKIEPNANGDSETREGAY